MLCKSSKNLLTLIISDYKNIKSEIVFYKTLDLNLRSKIKNIVGTEITGSNNCFDVYCHNVVNDSIHIYFKFATSGDEVVDKMLEYLLKRKTEAIAFDFSANKKHIFKKIVFLKI
ncbi:MAG: hypothetical protein RSE41_04145 [Clostridia bacterium]